MSTALGTDKELAQWKEKTPLIHEYQMRDYRLDKWGNTVLSPWTLEGYVLLAHTGERYWAYVGATPETTHKLGECSELSKAKRMVERAVERTPVTRMEAKMEAQKAEART